jgi:preprotein translocase subunit SecA
LLAEVRQAYAEGLVDETVADLEGIERDMISPKPWRRDRQRLITDAIAEMERWATFHREDSWLKKMPKLAHPVPPPAAPPPASYVAPKPLVREPKIGRNDPCPCGIGKKYKKCCGKG